MKKSFLFVFLFGLVSLFGDITYESARSIIGPYFAFLGASGLIVGFIAGLGEFIGYGLRLICGYFTDRLRKYWSITIAGYAIGLLSVPLLALAKDWQIASLLIIAERIGKALRSPAKDALLSYGIKEIGYGRGFGIHKAMDQIGAMIGPLIMSMVLYFKKDYQIAFGILIVPAIISLSILFLTKSLYPYPYRINTQIKSSKLAIKDLNRDFWLYSIGIALIGAGYIDFPLIAFHFKKISISESLIPIFYAIAMGFDAFSALVFGYLFDKKGLSVFIFSIILSSASVPLVFLGNFYIFFLGMIFWGIGIGAQTSIMKAIIPFLISEEKRGTGYGIINACYGFSWFLGSALIGYLYDFSILALIVISLIFQLSSIFFFIKIRKNLLLA